MIRLGLTIAAALVTAGPALAHHSGAMFDRSKEAVVSGTIKEFGWNNPHSWIKVVAADASGQTREYTVEMGPPSFLARAGWTRSTLKPGDRADVTIYPLKSGAAGGAFKQVKLADGRVLTEKPTAAD